MPNRLQQLLVLLVLAVLCLPFTAHADYGDLCTSVPSVCSYASPEASVLNEDVCLDSTGGLQLKGTGSCPAGSSPYTVEFGEVNPASGAVNGYIPLDDACEQQGLCFEFEVHAGGQESPMCCNAYTCYSNLACGGSLWWCYDGVTERDGTITCFMSEQIG